jgi:hypothetical protein
MPEPNALPKVLRAAVAVALVAWLAVAVWIVVTLVRTEATHVDSPYGSLGMLLLPAVLFGALALLFVLLPRRSAFGWQVVFLFGLLAIPAWLFLRGGAYRAVPWVDSAVVTAAVWMTLGLALGLVTLSLIALRHVSGPPSDRAAVWDETSTLSRLDTPESLVHRGFDDRGDPSGF